MHLKSITLKGFKSFPDRIRLEFGSGVSVIVGPNGSGKSNITDAVLWALGEQSPLAVRGQTMQDVIFAGGEGVKGRSAAEVEVVIDNSDGQLQSDFSEISITRRLDRSGEGVYRLNGARCRLVDVLEVLSDSGLGKEMHSVISQGRVEAIVHSKPPDRTVLIEEAAGLSKHRKRRHRAQLKLTRTQDNLSRALDVEREARSRLRPLKRQAEAAELHARLERQSLELRGALTHDTLLAVREELAAAELAAAEARRERDRLETEQAETGRRREQTERQLAEHGKEREQLSSLLFSTRSAGERIAMRLESTSGVIAALEARLERSRKAIDAIDPSAEGGRDTPLGDLESELRRLDRERDGNLAGGLERIERERAGAEARAAELGEQIDAGIVELERSERIADEARERRRLADEQGEEAARRRAALELELSGIVERQRLTSDADSSLARMISADEGFEPALAAALGGRLTAQVVEDLAEAALVLERAGSEGARTLLRSGRRPGGRLQPPTLSAEPLLDHVRCDAGVRELVERLLQNAWVVERLEDVPASFEGVAVTREGAAYHGLLGEARRPPVGSGERALSERGRRGQLEAELQRIEADLSRAKADAERASEAVRRSEQQGEAHAGKIRELRREREDALEEAHRAEWLSERRRDLGEGPEDARRATLVAEIAAERRLAERLARERSERAARRRRLEAMVERDRALLPAARRLTGALERGLGATQERQIALEQELVSDQEVGEQAAADLRRLAQSEYELQARLRAASERLTHEEVRVAQIRDREAAATSELDEISRRLGHDASGPLPATSGDGPLTVDQRAEVESRLERLERRRERLGPVNPLAESEYQEALEHVEDLERQRKDLEHALAELASLIRDTDQLIRESFEQTFEVTARNFEDVIQHLFPGGRGKLRLVRRPRPRVVLGGAEPDDVTEQAPEGAGFGTHTEPGELEAARGEEADETPGVEIEVTPAGKSTRRLSLLSGGEKSLVALAFLFAVFLARPCPFYILDEVEAALDDVNIDRFLDLVRGYSDRSQFIVITHQRRTMEAANVLYGVSMGGDGVSKVVSRRFDSESGVRAEPLTEAA
jgi:chromosome segregation protein